MRRFIITVTLLFVTATSVYSSDVKLAIFADSLASNCYIELDASNEIFKAYFFIMSDTPLRGVNFAIQWDKKSIDLLNFTHLGKLGIGDVETGMSLVFEECMQGPTISLGVGEFFIKDPSIKSDIQVLQNTDLYELSVCTCDPGYPTIRAKGARLAINYHQKSEESFWLSKLKKQEFTDELNEIKNESYSTDEVIKSYSADIVVMGYVMQINNNKEGPFHTYVTMHIDEVIKGNMLINRIRNNENIRFGLFGNDEFNCTLEPQLKIGHKYIIFLHRNIHKFIVISYYKDYYSFSEYFTIFNQDYVYKVQNNEAVNMRLPWKREALSTILNRIRLVSELMPIKQTPLPNTMDYKQLAVLSSVIVKGIVRDVKSHDYETFVVIDIETFLKTKWPGYLPQSVNIFLDFGTKVRSSKDIPSFFEGENVILFLRSKDPPSLNGPLEFPEYFVPLGGINSKYIIDENMNVISEISIIKHIKLHEFIDNISNITERLE